MVFGKLSKGDIVETPTGERGVIGEECIDSNNEIAYLVRFYDGDCGLYEKDELIKIDAMYRMIKKVHEVFRKASENGREAKNGRKN